MYYPHTTKEFYQEVKLRAQNNYEYENLSLEDSRKLAIRKILDEWREILEEDEDAR